MKKRISIPLRDLQAGDLVVGFNTTPTTNTIEVEREFPWDYEIPAVSTLSSRVLRVRNHSRFEVLLEIADNFTGDEMRILVPLGELQGVVGGLT